MKKLIPLIMLAIAMMVTSVFATGEKGSDAGAPWTIIQADAASITVATGKSGDVDSQKLVKINDYTGVMIDNQKVSARDLKAGMEAFVTFGPDGETAKWINAHDPKKK